MTEVRTAKELVEELNRLFDEIDFNVARDSLETGWSPEGADERVGKYRRFARGAIDPEVVVDCTSSGGLDYRGRFEGWSGWIDFWRRWFEPWDHQDVHFRELHELDAERVIDHIKVRNRGRGSGVIVEWEGWNLWVARDGKLTAMEQYESREEALAAARLHER